jgi:hypothetical protein
VDFQHVDAWGTGTATLHFRNEDLAFHFQRAFEQASLLVGAPPICLEVVNAKMPKTTAFQYTPQARQHKADSPNGPPPTGPPPPPPLEAALFENGVSPSSTPMWLQGLGEYRKTVSSPQSAKSESTVRAVALDFAPATPQQKSVSQKGSPGSPFDLPSLLAAPDDGARIPPLPLL